MPKLPGAVGLHGEPRDGPFAVSPVGAAELPVLLPARLASWVCAEPLLQSDAAWRPAELAADDGGVGSAAGAADDAAAAAGAIRAAASGLSAASGDGANELSELRDADAWNGSRGDGLL